MALEKIIRVTGTAALFPGDDVDTDRIIPARFMKCVTFDGLGQYLFYDVRFAPDGTATDHIFNRPEFSNATVLITGNNFGCGSSREHAPQAIYRYGFRAIIAEGFAEIFFGNCTTLGIPCVTMPRALLESLRSLVEHNPATPLTLDLADKTVTAGSQTYSFDLRESARNALLNGRWDPIGELLEAQLEVQKVAASLPYMAA